MELKDAIESAGTCRFFQPDPVPDDVLLRVLSASRFAPTGGNMQPVRFVVVRDPGKRRRLAEIYLPLWTRYVGGTARQRVEGRQRAAGGTPSTAAARMLENADHFARHLATVPVHVVVTAKLLDILATDAALDRLSVVGGASIYPSVQNLLLSCREEGLGAALTTLLCYEETAVRELLGIPDGYATAAMLAVGWPERPFPKRLSRRPVERIAFAESFGSPFAVE